MSRYISTITSNVCFVFFILKCRDEKRSSINSTGQHCFDTIGYSHTSLATSFNILQSQISASGRFINKWLEEPALKRIHQTQYGQQYTYISKSKIWESPFSFFLQCQWPNSTLTHIQPLIPRIWACPPSVSFNHVLILSNFYILGGGRRGRFRKINKMLGTYGLGTEGHFARK